MSDTKHVVVIGAGPGGYPAAFYAADLGLRVTLIDPEENPGGTCLFRGCIPSKALLHVSSLLHEAREATHWGVKLGEPQVDLDRLREWKDEVVKDLTGGTGGLGKKRGVTHVRGMARFTGSNSVEVELVDGGKQQIEFDHAILSTGSRSVMIPGVPEGAEDRIWDSTKALELERVPRSLLVIGGGVIGLELGSVYSALGSQVSVVEMLPGLIPGADRDLVRVLQGTLKAHFKEILVKTKVAGMRKVRGGIEATLQLEDGSERTERYDRVLVSVGRRPNSENLGLENTQVQLDERGFVQVDQRMATSDRAIFAIGDLVGQPMLAHKATAEAKVAVEAILGQKGAAFDPACIPSVVYTDPEVAWCGLTETEAKEQKLKVKVVRFPWQASGRALAMARPDGMTKLIIDTETERVLGMGVVGKGAGELIAEGALAVEMAALASDLARTIHPHPTVSETVMEAAEVFYGHATHFFTPKKRK